MEQVFLSMSDIEARYSVTRCSVYRWMRNGSFPLPVKFGSVTRWNLAEVEQWERDFIAQRPQKLKTARG